MVCFHFVMPIVAFFFSFGSCLSVILFVGGNYGGHFPFALFKFCSLVARGNACGRFFFCIFIYLEEIFLIWDHYFLLYDYVVEGLSTMQELDHHNSINTIGAGDSNLILYGY